MKLFSIVSPGKKLEEVLRQGLDQYRFFLKGNNENLLKEAHVYLREKKITRFQAFIKKGAIVSLLVPDHFLIKFPFTLSSQHVVYEDDEIIVVDKPSGLPTQSTQKLGEDHLYGAVITYLTEKNLSKLAYVGLHHRLDRDTSGLVLLTKKSSMNKSISDQFKEHKIHKKYLAISSGIKPKELHWKVDTPIGRDYGSKEFRFRIDKKKGDAALTQFQYLDDLGSNTHKIECMPITGRTHQIRIHLASVQLPILGDRLYGVKDEVRMQLHAHQLQFTHPKTQKKMTITSQRNLEKDRLV